MKAQDTIEILGDVEQDRLAIGLDSRGISIFDYEKERELASFTTDDSPTAAFAFSPTRGYLATAGTDGVVRLWRARAKSAR